MITRYLVILLMLGSGILFGQAPYVLPGTQTDDIAQRWDILYDFDHEVFSSQRNTSRKDITLRALQLYNAGVKDGDIKYILEDNVEYTRLYQRTSESVFDRTKVYDSTGTFYYIENAETIVGGDSIISPKRPVFKHFYKTRANFFEVQEEDFTLIANPILNINFGSDSNDPNSLFQNTRGIEIRGIIDDKIYFYTSILENQARFNNYLEARITRDQAIPGQGFFKPFESGVIESFKGRDFLNAQAYVGINASKSVAIEFGHGQHFIGNGMRSLLLSNYAHNYFYLKFNTRIWKLHYQNVFAELAPISSLQNPSDRLLPKKYMANHYLAYKPTKNFEIGLFETVMFSRENQFEFQYLNPVILYRTVEQFLDSPDNVLIGLNGKWNVKNRVQLYGQLILDEFKLSEITANEGWWGNKYGLQAGAKYINAFGINNLDVQAEYNRVRPFTYAHRDSLENFEDFSTASYSHFNQPLAHALGANFKELVFHVRYRPTSNLTLNARVVSSTFGQDQDGENNGGNILLRTGLRDRDYGHSIGQGVMTDVSIFRFDLSYQFYHNYFLDFNALFRKSDAALDEFDIDTQYFGGGIRVNIGNLARDY